MSTNHEGEVALTDQLDSRPDAAQANINGVQQSNGAQDDLVRLSHRLQHDKSILAIAVSSRHIYAGTESGEILVYFGPDYLTSVKLMGI